MLSLQGTIASGVLGACCAGGPLQTMFAVDFSKEFGDAKRLAGTIAGVDLGTYVSVPGIGSDSGVPRATFLFVRSSTRVVLRMTTDATVSGDPDDVTEIALEGLGIWSFATVNRLKLLEFKGSGTLEFVASGT